MDRRERLAIPTEIVGSRALNLGSYEGKERGFSDEELREDIVSYLSEYRLNVQKYNYQLKFVDGKICDKNGEAMIDKAQRAINFKRQRGENTDREEAELLGLQSSGDKIRFIKDQSATLFWASPPGRKEEGYGNYGFVFAGEHNPLTTDISMTAIRIENPTITQFNKAMSLLTGREFRFSQATDFLSSPIVLRGDIDERFIDRVLENSFSFKENLKNQETSSRIIQKLDSKIDEFIKTHRNLSREERLRLFNTLENYAIKLRERYEREEENNIIYLDDYREDRMRLMDLSGRYGYKAPVVGGSCGGTGKEEENNRFGISSNILSFSFEALRKAIFGGEDKDYTFDKEGTCKVCAKSSGEVGKLGPCYICRQCDTDIRNKSAA